MAKEERIQGEVGLVIAEDGILLTGIGRRHGARAVTYGTEGLPLGAVEGAVIHNPQAVAQALRKLQRELNLQSRSTSVVLLAPGYTTRALRLPDSPPGERRTLVRGELEEAGALPFGNGAFDFLWVTLPTEGNRRQADAYAYYTSDAVVDGVRESLRLAGMQMECIEPYSLAMMRAYLAAMPRRHPIALLCPSEKHSDLCIHDGTQIRQLRRIPAGWAEFAQKDASSADRGLPRSIENIGSGPLAEDIARLPILGEPEIDLPPLEAATLPVEEPTGTSSTSSSIGLRRISSIAFLTSEVMRSLAFYAREYEDWAQPEALAIVSADDMAPDFREMLSGSLSIPVLDLDPLVAYDVSNQGLAVGSAKARNGFLAAIGAALGDMEASIPRVDISLQEAAAKVRRRAPVVILAGMAASTLWMILSAVAAVTLTILQSSREVESIRLDQQITAARATLAPKIEYQEVARAARGAAAKAKVPAAAILGRLAASTTPGVEVHSLHVGGDGKVTIEGRALDHVSIEQFVSNLGQSHTLRLPSPFYEVMRGDKEEIVYRISGRFRPPPPPPPPPPAAPAQSSALGNL